MLKSVASICVKLCPIAEFVGFPAYPGGVPGTSGRASVLASKQLSMSVGFRDAGIRLDFRRKCRFGP